MLPLLVCDVVVCEKGSELINLKGIIFIECAFEFFNVFWGDGVEESGWRVSFRGDGSGEESVWWDRECDWRVVRV